jgi:SOS-response transcriptional repressor LexA
VRTGRITPAITIPVGRQKITYYSPQQVDEIIKVMNLKKHSDETQYDDFIDFVEKVDFSMSYKLIMLLSMLKVVDHNGECKLDDLLEEYTNFYRYRLNARLAVDRENSPYAKIEFLNDLIKMKSSLLKNPFEKFERKRFMYHCKDLNHIAFSNNLWNKINNKDDLKFIRNKYFTYLLSYYEDLGGVPNELELRDRWGIDNDEEGMARMIDFPTEEQKFSDYIPFFEIIAAARGFGSEQFRVDEENHKGWIKAEGRLSHDMFALVVKGKSMEPKIPDGSICLFRGGSALAGSRNGRDLLVMHRDAIDRESNSRFTVKRYQSEKIFDEYGDFIHSKVTLSPLNREFDPIEIRVASEDEFKIIGEFIRVLE